MISTVFHLFVSLLDNSDRIPFYDLRILLVKDFTSKSELFKREIYETGFIFDIHCVETLQDFVSSLALAGKQTLSNSFIMATGVLFE